MSAGRAGASGEGGMADRQPEMLGPTLLSGLLFGVLVGLPWVKVFNVCSGCSLVILTGFAASWLYSRRCRNDGVEFRPATGAMVGLIAGTFHGVTVGIVDPIMTGWVGEPGLTWLLERIRDASSTPPETMESVDELLLQMSRRSYDPATLIYGIASSILGGVILSTLGGLVGGAVFRVPAVEQVRP